MNTNLTRRDCMRLMTCGAASLAVPQNASGKAKSGKRPNIVLIMADDMGYSDIGCYGGEVNTPNIDRLAHGGIRFTQFYNCAKCGPTRATLLTGLYNQQVGVHGYPDKMRSCVTIAEALKSVGYRTLMTGKWHAGELPVERGFDRYYGLTDGCCNFFNPGRKRIGEPEPGRKGANRIRKWAIEDQVFRPYTPKDKDFYTTDAFTDYALDYLDEYADEDKPFFLYLAYTAPHYPLHAFPEDIAKYKGKYMDGWERLREQRYKRMVEMGLIDPRWKMSPRDPTVPRWEEVDNKDEWDLKMAVYAAMIDRMDWNIGRVMKKIRDLGEEENTLVMFLSDNGGCAEEENKTPDTPPGPVESYRSVDKPWANASNTPFRKYKSWDHEGGICTPFVAYWPKVIGNNGGITREVGHIIDVLATCIDIAGAEYPSRYKDHDVLPLEGKSLLPVFETGERQGHDALFWEFAGRRAVREGKWKLVAKRDGDWELYDMEKDRTELHNLADTYPERVKRMAAMHDAWVEKCERMSSS